MRVLILGAGIFHSKSIVDIKDAGFEVIVLDGNPTAPALKIADHSEVCDITNKSVVYELAKKWKVDGIVPLNDFGTRSAFYASQKVTAHLSKLPHRDLW